LEKSEKAEKQEKSDPSDKKGKQKGNKKGKQDEEEKLDYNQVMGTANIARGKHSKIKKMKEKYAEQDQEEREMRMKLMGTKEVKGFDLAKHQELVGGFSKTDEAKSDSLPNPETESHSEVQEEVEMIYTETKPSSHEEKLREERDEKEEKDEETKTEQDVDEEAEIAKLIKEEDINLVPETVDVSEIDKLTGNPKPTDELLFAVPMLAPYSTINTYKFKVKVLPGTQKRGTAQKSIRSLFLAQSNKQAMQEQHMIKAVSDTEMTMALINSCRVMAPGLQKIQQ